MRSSDSYVLSISADKSLRGERRERLWCSPETKCDAPLPCGHTCQSIAHDVDIEHQTSHQCQKTCNTTLPCGHVCASLCHEVDPEHKALYKCPVKCEGLLVCGHECRIKAAKHGCSKHTQCLEKCGYMLQCGHLCSLLCHHLVSDHMKCFSCASKPSGSLPPSNGNEPMDDDKSSGPACLQRANTTKDVPLEMKPAGSSSGGIMALVRPGHTCRVGGICWRKCKASLSCGHKCVLRCHKEYTHNATNICEPCSAEVKLREDFSRLQVDHAEGTTLTHCFHHVKMFECNKMCKGRLCGHPCGLSDPHKCSEHIDTNKVLCSRRCEAVLPCNHFCFKSCHIDDISHKCSPNNVQCVNAFKMVELNLGPTEGVNDVVIYPAHKHSADGVCRKKCKSFLSCGHQCTLQCNLHKQFPHVSSHKCQQCTLSDTLLKELSVFQVPYSKGTSFDYCSHLVKGYKCEQTCEGRRCEHPCGLAEPHKCSDHAAYNKIECRIKCGTKMSCGHKCCKACHVGDYEHKCRWMVRNNKPRCLGAPDVDQASNPQHTVGNASDLEQIVSSEKSKDVHTASNQQEIPTAGISCDHTCHLCPSCTKTYALREEFSSLQIHHTVGVVNHCSHHVKMYECEQICKGRLCGHPCDLKKPHHTCLDHVALNKVSCRETCGADLSCGRKCYRACHVGDGFHQCKAEIEETASPLGDAEINGQRPNDGMSDSEPKSCSNKPSTEALPNAEVKDPEVAIPGNELRIVEGTRSQAVVSCGHICGHSRHSRRKLRSGQYIYFCVTCGKADAQNTLLQSPSDPPHQNGKKTLSKRDETVDTVGVAERKNPLAKYVSRIYHKNHKVDGVCEEVCGAITASKCGHKQFCHFKCHFESDPEKHEINSCGKPCKGFLSCGHRCSLRCNQHKKTFTHGPNDRCGLCSFTDLLKGKSPSPELEMLPTNLCCHLAERYACDKYCQGRPCGHKCSLHKGSKAHKCCDHAASNEKLCVKPCKVKLSCSHACSKPCHVYDYTHYCSSKGCINSQRPSILEIQNCVAGENSKDSAVLRVNDHVPSGPARHSAATELASELPNNTGRFKNPPAKLVARKIRKPGDGSVLSLASSGHSCLWATNEACTRACKFVMKCGHKCPETCHNKRSPHERLEKCEFCLKSDLFKKHFSPFSTEIAVTHCSHLVERRSCEAKCKQFLCGHKAKENVVPEVVCQASCTVVLPCNHQCRKHCHFGDEKHECKTNKACSGKPKKCNIVFGCGHRCRKIHEGEIPHESLKRCDFCFKSKELCQALVKQGNCENGDLPAKKDDYCAHFKQFALCDQKCESRYCGHRCSSPEDHVCSDHARSKQTKCVETCDVVLRCGHACAKICHVGDCTHDCKGPKCRKTTEKA